MEKLIKKVKDIGIEIIAWGAYSDWNSAMECAEELEGRLPTVDELKTIYVIMLDKKITLAEMSMEFGNTCAWSSEKYRTDSACGVDFFNGYVYNGNKASSRFVFVVRDIEKKEKKMVYQIEVVEQTSKIYDIEAESEEEAVEIVEVQYEKKELKPSNAIMKKTTISNW